MISSNAGIISRKVGRDSTHSSSSNNLKGGEEKSAGGNEKNKKVPDPVDDFVFMEFDLAGEICGIVDNSLSSLKKVLFGSGLLTPAIQTAATNLLNGNVPQEWKKLWDGGPEKPQAWLREIVRKRLSLNKWKTTLSKGGSSGLLSTPLSLNDLFNPGTFINALRQQTARQLRSGGKQTGGGAQGGGGSGVVAIDMMKMVCAWGEKDIRRMKSDFCPLPCTLSNLLLQGAMFANNALQESSPEGSELIPINDVCIGFVLKSAPDTYEQSEAVSIPMYLNPTREEFLVEIQMPMSRRDEQDRWILAGVALFLSEED
jgi:dynein heavy chain 2